MSLKKLLVVFIILLLILTGCSSTPEEPETPVVADSQPQPDPELDPAEPIEEPQEPPVSDPFDFKIDADFPSDPAAGTFLFDKYELTKPYLDIGYDVLKTNINMFLLELSGDNPRTIYELEQFNYVDDPTGLGPSNWFMVRHHNPNGSEEMIDYNEFSALIDGTVSTFTNVLGLDYETYMRYTQEARENIKTEEAFNYDSEMVEVIKYQLESTGINMENPDIADLLPFYITIFGRVGQQDYSTDLNNEYINQYVGESIEYRFNMADPEEDNALDAYYNFGQRILDESEGNYDYVFAFDSKIDQLITENARYRVTTTGNPNQQTVYLKTEFIESIDNPDFENLRSNLEIFLASLPAETNASTLIDEAHSHFERMLNEDSYSDEHLLLDGGNYVVVVEKNSFYYGTRILFIGLLDEVGGLAPLPQ